MLVWGNRYPTSKRMPAYELKVEGDVDLDTVSELEGRLARVIALGWAPILLDLSRCGFIDSSGIRALLRAHRELLRRRGPLRPALALVALTSSMRRALELTAVDSVIPIFPTDTAAVEALTSTTA
jgi:anti-sigma B factor antagonist